MRNDKILWLCLALFGLNFVKYRCKPCIKYFRNVFMVTFASSLTYTISINIVYLINKHYKEGVSYILLPINCALMWYFSYSKRKEFSRLLLQIYSYRKRYLISNRRCYIMPFTIIILLSPYVTAVVFHIMLNLETEILNFWTFGFEIENIFWKRFILFIASVAYLVFCIDFPFYLTFAFNILFYRCSEVLTSYNIVLHNQLQENVNGNIDVLKEFFDIMKVVKKLNDSVTKVSLLIIFYGLEGIFCALLTVSFKESPKIHVGYIIIAIYYSTLSAMMFVSYTLCSTMIPLRLMRIKNDVKEFLNKYGYDNYENRQCMYYLKRIENEEIVYVSVCGLFHLTRNVLLTALGAVLTYGLLITNLNI